MTDENQNQEQKEEEVKTTPPQASQAGGQAASPEADYEEKWKRALADYDNLKKETVKEKSEMAQFARGMAALDFLEVYENLKKAYNTDVADSYADDANHADVKKIENWKQGLGHILKQFAGALKDLGVEEIKTAGEKFDPNLHEAAGEEVAPSSDGVSTSFRQPGIIIREIAGGYKMGDKVVKAAKVIISK